MATKLSEWTKLSHRRPTPMPHCSGEIMFADFWYSVVGERLDADDIVDIGILPARCEIVDWYAWCEADVGNITLTAGILAGEIGDDVSVRVLGTELFSAASIDTGETSIVRGALVTGLKIAASESDRSIGLEVGTDIEVGAGKIIHLGVWYRMNAGE
ncbi:MAG: hypothetical protein KGZ69_01435 [Methylomonas sp.]|nr:hypothetical protein [Methylomonas sp.]